MVKIINSKATGKTHDLMLNAQLNNGVIACSNPYAMREKAHGYGIVGIDFISYNDAITHNYENTNIYIDEIDKFLKFINNDINGYTLSTED